MHEKLVTFFNLYWKVLSEVNKKDSKLGELLDSTSNLVGFGGIWASINFQWIRFFSFSSQKKDGPIAKQRSPITIFVSCSAASRNRTKLFLKSHLNSNFLFHKTQIQYPWLLVFHALKGKKGPWNQMQLCRHFNPSVEQSRSRNFMMKSKLKLQLASLMHYSSKASLPGFWL